MVGLIMPCHYVMSGGTLGLVDSSHLTFNMYFAEIFSRVGRMGNNCFMLITGYFMCLHSFSLQKFYKILLQVTFYAVLIYLLFVLTGWADFSLKRFCLFLFSVPCGVGSNFIGSFMAVYLLCPFFNKLVTTLDEKTLRNLLIVLILIFSVCNTVFSYPPRFEMVGWYATVYVTGSYLRLFPPSIFLKKGNVLLFLIVNLVIIIGSILLITFLSQYNPVFLNYAQIALDQSNYIMSYSCAVAFFLFFKSLKIPNSIVINKIAATTLGVLCIHEHSSEMHKFLYDDLFNVKENFDSIGFPFYMFVCIIITYLFCVVIDLLRQRFLEKPLLSLMDRIQNK